MCKQAFKKLWFLVKYVSDRYKTQQMCYKIILKMVGCQFLFLDPTKIKTWVI